LHPARRQPGPHPVRPALGQGRAEQRRPPHRRTRRALRPAAPGTGASHRHPGHHPDLALHPRRPGYGEAMSVPGRSQTLMLPPGPAAAARPASSSNSPRPSPRCPRTWRVTPTSWPSPGPGTSPAAAWIWGSHERAGPTPNAHAPPRGDGAQRQGGIMSVPGRRLITTALLVALCAAFLYQIGLLGMVVWFNFRDPSNTPIMQDTLNALRAEDPDARLAYE